MVRKLVGRSSPRSAFLFLFWLALIPIWVLAIGEVVSNLTGQQWIPSLGGIQWAFLLILALILVMLRMVAEEVFTSEEEQDE